MSNKKSGNDFEKDFCKLASKAGFWAHILQDNHNGQPADVIITKNGKAALVDCKDCEKDIFLFNRIEENQELSMTKWLKTGNRNTVFVLKVSSGVRVSPFQLLYNLREHGIKQLNLDQILEYSWSLEEWMEGFDENNSQ